MFKTVYMYNSFDLDRLGTFYPREERHHKDWVIPPSNTERA